MLQTFALAKVSIETVMPRVPLTRGTHQELVQHLLGHAPITMALDCYSRWTPSLGRHAANEIDEALG
jgi:hypothetical protein